MMVRHRHDGRSYWTLPGGGVEADEAPEKAAERELFEETGMVGSVQRPLFDEPFRTGSCRCFLVSVEESEDAALGFDPEEADEHASERMLQEVAWHELSAMSHDRQVGQVLQSLAQA